MPMRRSAGEIKPRWVPLSVRRDFFENLFQGGLRFPVPFLLRAVAIEHNPREIERSLKIARGQIIDIAGAAHIAVAERNADIVECVPVRFTTRDG